MTSVEDALRSFGTGALSFADLREALRGTAEFGGGEGSGSVHFLGQPLPEVELLVADVRRMLERFLSGHISETEFVTWATVLMLLGCYELKAEAGESVVIAWSAIANFSAPAASHALERENAHAWLKRLSIS